MLAKCRPEQHCGLVHHDQALRSWAAHTSESDSSTLSSKDDISSDSCSKLCIESGVQLLGKPNTPQRNLTG